MLSNEYLFSMNSIRSAQATVNSFQNFYLTNPNLYSNQITRIFQYCDESGLKKSTKYIVKKLVDKYLISYPETEEAQWEMIMISFFRYATKFNQVADISDTFTLDQCVRLCGQSFSRDQFHSFQNLIFLDPQFRQLIFSSPYDYFQTFRQVFTLMPKLAAKIQVILDFCITIPQFIYRSAQEIFFGSLWMIKLCKQQNFQLDQKWIKAQTMNWKNSFELGERLKIYYQAQIQAAMQEEQTEM